MNLNNFTLPLTVLIYFTYLLSLSCSTNVKQPNGLILADTTFVDDLNKSKNGDPKDIDYMSLEEESSESEINASSTTTPTTTKKAPAWLSQDSWSHSQTSKPVQVSITKIPNISLLSSSKQSTGIINNMSDIVKLVRLVFLRGHIVLDATHRVIVKNESRIERLMNYLHDIQLRRGKHRLLPMEDRDLACDKIPDSKIHVKELCKAATFDCLSASEMIQMLPPSVTFHQAIARICPLLLFRQSRPICVADAKKLIDSHISKKIQLVEPSIERVWGFGVLFVTISIMVSMGGLIVLPFLKKSSRTTILTFFEGLAVGGLCGSAILHLFPQAFDIVDEKYRAYFWNTTSIFGGIYLFYCFEMLLKIMKTYYSKGRRKRVPSVMFRDENIVIDNIYNTSTSNSQTINSNQRIRHSSSSSSDDDDINHNTMVMKPGPVIEEISAHTLQQMNAETSQTVVLYGARQSQQSSPTHTIATANKEALISSTREQLVQCLSTVNVMSPVPAVIARQGTPATPLRRPTKERMVLNVALRRQDHESSNTIVIDTVAWMIVLGDALLNFIDGLSIGAAFDRNILAGMSISVAVMLEEVTHRLGTFAVLIRAGMSMKQSFLYIFLSACACYPGLALGIFLGDEAEDASPYIFALAGGFFLYMALVDVMKAMTRTIENASRKSLRSLLHIWALQNVGIVLAAISLALLAFYEKEMDFERQEIAEIKKNSFV